MSNLYWVDRALFLLRRKLWLKKIQERENHSFSKRVFLLKNLFELLIRNALSIEDIPT